MGSFVHMNNPYELTNSTIYIYNFMTKGVVKALF